MNSKIFGRIEELPEFEKENKIELIEIYYKGEKDKEDRERILRHYRIKAIP